MGIAEEFESRLERLVEGVFSKAFRSAIEPAEIGRALVRKMEAGKTVSVGAVYVPNLYEVTLATPDLERIGGLRPTLEREFADLLTKTSKSRNWRLPGAVVVRFMPSDEQRSGKFAIDALHADIASPAGILNAQLELVDSEPAQSWRLRSDRPTVIGRGEASEIMVLDANVSRQHARITFEEDHWWLEDLGSTNGTFLNERMTKRSRVTEDDLITVGNTQLRFLRRS